MTDAEREKRERVQWIEDLKALLDVPEFRRFAWALLGKAGIAHLSFDPRSPDAQRTAYFEGRRALGVELLGDITLHFPVRYVQMIQEAASDGPGGESGEREPRAGE